MNKQQAYLKLLDEFAEIVQSNNQDLIQENANVDGKSPMGMMGLFASTSAKFYSIENLLSDEVKQAYFDGYIHIHDLDFYASGTSTCCQIPLDKVLQDGFDTGHGHMREPNSIMSAMALASIIFQSNQNQQHGGQAMSNFDFDLAPYVRKSYEKNVQLLENVQANCDIEEKSWELTERDVYQACEAFIHNSNSMHSRGGGQVPFISINYGLDTSKEGRMIVKNMLLATQKGLGNGETPIFPIQILKVKDGINTKEDDPNYDLFRLSLETTAKRLFPNYVFVDAPFNLQYYKADDKETHIATMGCRTRTISNVNGKETPVGRGNLSFTSINLPLLALESNNIDQFFENLEQNVDLACQQLYERFMYQSEKTALNFRFLYGQGVWRGGEELGPNDQLKEVLKQGTLSVGYVGLAEALVALIGKHHGESKEAQELGLKIVSFMREKMDKQAEETGLNYTLLATPAESYAGKALKIACSKHGIVKGVTDKEWFTNSNHVPVEYKINAVNKIKIEAPYHALTNAGHITYVELAEDASKNIDALETYVMAMKNSGIGYGSFNVPVDRCMECGYSGVIYNECPKCGNHDEYGIERIRRITGYLVGSLNKWNSSKRSEAENRIKHGKTIMKIMNIDTDCTDNGKGIRTVIYVSGCTHYCEGCHNSSSWNPNNGYDYGTDELIEMIEENSLAEVTISGGDSLTFQYEETLKLVKMIKDKTNKNIWLYTGYIFEEILENKKEILPYIDVMVDGRFEIAKKDLNLLFRGSSNQRIIDVQQSVKQEHLVLWEQGQYDKWR